MPVCDICLEETDDEDMTKTDGEPMCRWCADHFYNEAALHEDAMRKAEEEF